MPRTDWVTRQIESSWRNIAEWPSWMRREAGIDWTLAGRHAEGAFNEVTDTVQQTLATVLRGDAQADVSCFWCDPYGGRFATAQRSRLSRLRGSLGDGGASASRPSVWPGDVVAQGDLVMIARKKPLLVDARRVEVPEGVETANGLAFAQAGDYVITAIEGPTAGDRWIVKSEICHATYDFDVAWHEAPCDLCGKPVVGQRAPTDSQGWTSAPRHVVCPT